MNHNKISALHSKAFEGLDTLEILTLYENKISNIESDAFKGLDKWVKILYFICIVFLFSYNKQHYCVITQQVKEQRES